ncbi:MAG: TIGR02270 family protein [Desulfobacteraceae bacterium]|nr:TIGR02270 family protein [Desulfobacteraceae bacterium]
MPIIPEIIFQHAEESAFLWLLRDHGVHEPHYSLADQAHLDDRVESHIDGLRIAGDEGWEIVKEELSWEEPGELFTASVLAFEDDIEQRIQTVLETDIKNHELSRGLISALGWLPFDRISRHVRHLLSGDAPDLRRMGLAASAVHGRDPGQPLEDALSDDDIMLKARAFKAVGELGLERLLPALIEHLNDRDEKCRFFAAWSAGMFKAPSSLPVLQSIAGQGGLYSEQSCRMALRSMDLHEGHAWLEDLSRQEELQKLALKGYGALGDPTAVPLLIQAMENPDLARVAGESLSMITGVDIAYEDLEGEWPQGFEAGPGETAGDEDVEMDPDEDLPWPEPELMEQWWSQKKNSFQTGKRYLLGKPISVEQLHHVLGSGFQRQRAQAAIELAMINPGHPLFEVRAPGGRQQRLLGRQGG